MDIYMISEQKAMASAPILGYNVKTAEEKEAAVKLTRRNRHDKPDFT